MLRVRGYVKMAGDVFFCLKVTMLLASMGFWKLGLMSREILSCPACLSYVDGWEK